MAWILTIASTSLDWFKPHHEEYLTKEAADEAEREFMEEASINNAPFRTSVTELQPKMHYPSGKELYKTLVPPGMQKRTRLREGNADKVIH